MSYIIIAIMLLFNSYCFFSVLNAFFDSVRYCTSLPQWEESEQPYYLDSFFSNLSRQEYYEGRVIISDEMNRFDFEGAQQLAELFGLVISLDVGFFDHMTKTPKTLSEGLIIIGNPATNLGWYYYNFNKPLPICFFDEYLLVRQTEKKYFNSGMWGEEGFGSKKLVTDYAVIELYNDLERDYPVLLISGITSVATKIACQYIVQTMLTNETLPHSHAIILEIKQPIGDPLIPKIQIIEVVK